MNKPPLTTVQQYAIVQRAFMSRKCTLAIYRAFEVKPPWFLAVTYLGRVKQFYRRSGRKWPWRD